MLTRRYAWCFHPEPRYTEEFGKLILLAKIAHFSLPVSSTLDCYVVCQHMGNSAELRKKGNFRVLGLTL